MSYQRIERISEEVRREVDRIIRDEVSDPPRDRHILHHPRRSHPRPPLC